MKTFELPKKERDAAIASIKRYCAEELPEPIGDLPAGLLLNFFLEEIGPVIYNRAVADAQTRMASRVADLNGELFADEFQYWVRVDAKRKRQKVGTRDEGLGTK
ncbi:MAG TPA: DUF2164 domain-containing protein [Terracidiphilus sp.]|jgi:uncharacterized protein (DUF2164 family)|nr:DUF2164 domain-containing protein [Terracidiphilus sp.]